MKLGDLLIQEDMIVGFLENIDLTRRHLIFVSALSVINVMDNLEVVEDEKDDSPSSHASSSSSPVKKCSKNHSCCTIN